MNDSIKILIKKHTRDFLESRLSTIQKIRFEDFEINPYLIASVKNQLGMKKQRDLARWLVTQRSERGMVTAFGSTLQKIAKEFSDEPTTSGFTMTLKKRGKKYNIIVTSGPNPYAKTQAVDLRNRLIASKEIDPNSTPILGMCYGNEDAVSPIVKSELKNIKYYAGREFWEFISGEKNCRDEIIDILRYTADNFYDLEKRTIEKLTNDKIDQLEISLKNIFGEDPDEFWEKILKDLYI